MKMRHPAVAVANELDLRFGGLEEKARLGRSVEPKRLKTWGRLDAETIALQRDHNIIASWSGVSAHILPKGVDSNGYFDAARRHRYGENKPFSIPVDGGETARCARQGDGPCAWNKTIACPALNSGTSETGTAMTPPFEAR
jgi:hypothetical protein